MFETLALPVNLAIFAAAGALVWAGGTRIARYADAIAEKTGIGQAILGILLLGGVTSLPELAVASTAAVAGHPALSVNDVLGSAAINVVIIAVADVLIGRDAITSALASPPVLMQGVLGIVLLAMVTAATLTFDMPLLGASVWSWALALGYLGAVYIIAKSKSGRAWKATDAPKPHRHEQAPHPGSLRSLYVKTAGAGAAVLVGGFFLAKTAEAIAVQSGLGTSFVGAVLLGFSTSLPEVSTVIAAVGLKRYEMAVADIFGTNMFNVTIIFVADLLYDGPPVLEEAGRFAGFAALLAIVLTAFYIAGMIERRDRTVARMGYDSLAAIVTYAAGIVLLYQLR